jgi:hypothetical protein
MRKTRTFVTVAVAALAAAVLVGSTPSLFARGTEGGGGGGGSGGGRTGGGVTPDDDPNAPPPDTTGANSPKGMTSSSGKRRDDRTDLPEFRRDGEEQTDIARDARGSMARARFRDSRDARNRAAGEPRRDGTRR